MAKSAFVEVNITNPTRLAQDSQDTANNAVKGVTDLNDPNLMSVIEKQNSIGQFAGLTSQFSVLVQNAKDDGIDTTAVTTAYNNLNRFMADILTDPNHASDIDRVTYKKYQDAYNQELAKLQNALQNNTNDKFTSAASAISQAASTANVAKSAADSAYTYANSEIAVQSTATAKAQSAADGAFSQAQVVGSQADSAIAVQSTATAKAQSAADNALTKAEEVDGKTSAEIAKQSAATAKAQEAATSALDKAQSAADYTDKQIASQASAVSEVSKNAAEASSKADSALDTANGANAEIVKLKGGSTATIAKLEDGLGTKVSSDTFDSYQTQTASQFAQTVKEADFKTYQTQTSELIESKVDNGTYQTDKTQTAEAIGSKVSSGEFKTYQTQTDKAIKSKVDNGTYESDREQTASQIADKVSNGEFSTYKTQTDELIGSKVDNGDFKTYQTQTSELINSKVDNGTYQSDKTQTANQIASKVSSADFNSYKSQTDKAIESKVESKAFETYQQQTDTRFSTTVKAVQTQIQDSAVGTNLLVGTSRDLQTAPDSSGKLTGGLVHSFSRDELNFLSGNQVTLRAFIHNTTTHTVNLVLFTRDNAIPFGVGTDVPAGADGYSTITAFNISSSVPSGDISIRAYTEDTAIGGVQYKELKLEKGSIATDWCLNPAETATNSQITQLSGQIDQKVSSGDFNSYKTQTDELIGQKVDNGAFKTYQNQTAELIASKVDNGTYQSDKTQTANAIASKVSSNDFKTYQTQTDKLIKSKVDNGTYQSDRTQTANQIADKVSNGTFNTYKTQTDKLIAEKVSNGDFSTYKSQTADLISQKVATKDFSAYQATTAKAISSKVESSDFNTYKTQTADEISSKVESSNFQALKTQVQNSAVGTNLLLSTGDLSANWGFNGTVDTSQKPAVLHYPMNSLTSGNYVIAQQSLNDGLLQPSTTYTASFYAKGEGTFAFYCYPAVSEGGGDNHTNIKLTSDYKLYTKTFTTDHNISGGKALLLRQDYSPSATDQNTVEAYVYGLKLEKGSLATDWSLNPEDQATQSQFTQLSDDMNLRVKKGDLVDQINLQAGNTLISSSGQLTLSGKSVFLDSVDPVIMKSANIDKLLVGKKLTAADISANTFTTNNGTFTVNQNGAITAKNMTLIGGTLTSPTINAGVISGSTINGTTFHGGDIINNANNMSHFYPTTISSNGHIYTIRFSSSDAMQTDLSTGSLTTKYRAVNSTSNNQYEAYDTLLEANQIVLSAGHTNGKDMSFSQSVSGNNRDGYVLISPLDGITLHGDSQWIRFNGYANDSNPSGIVMTPWGNINPQGNQTDWYVGNKNTDKTAQFGIDSGHQVTINLFRATFVDEIGAMGNRLTNGRLLLHAVDGNAQMYLLNDGSPAVVSPTIYNRTYSSGANVHVTSYGRIGRSTSASKYKLAIARSDDTVQADRLMTLKPASWNDKVATEKMAESLSNGEIPVEEEINLKRHYGLIAEDLRDAGLDEFLITGKDGQIEGIEYDRLWTVLIPKIKQLNNRINELERKTL